MLLQNGYSGAFGALRHFGAGVINGAYPNVAQSIGYLTGQQRNIFMGEADVDPKSSQPAGARHPVAWQMPQKAGGLASRNAAQINITNTALAVRGLPATGSTTISLVVSDATGGLVVSASGLATISLSVTGTILSIAAASGSATVTLTPTAAIGAQAGIAGQATVTLTPAANISAIGYMSGLSTNETEFSAAALANAVWTATAADYNGTGTMGEKLNAAGGGSSPSDIAQGVWGYIIESGFDAQEILRLLTAVAVGNATGLEGAAPTFKNIADTKTRITATYANGTRTVTALDAT